MTAANICLNRIQIALGKKKSRVLFIKVKGKVRFVFYKKSKLD